MIAGLVAPVTHFAGLDVRMLIAAVLLAFLAYGTSRVLVSDGPGVWIRKRVLEPVGWSSGWASLATGVEYDSLSDEDDRSAFRRTFKERKHEFKVGNFGVSSPFPAVARFVYKLTECPFCVGFHASWIGWSIVFGFHPLTLAWWVGVFIVRGLQSFLQAVGK